MTTQWLKPLSYVYQGVTDIRNQMFDRRWLKVENLPVPVVSIGNITTGGTGKTPMVLHLCEDLRQKGISIGVISRGYGRSEKGTREVSSFSATSFGDEPALIKRRFPEVPVFVGESRLDAGIKLLKSHNVDLIIADDAFQHRYLHRDMNIVLLDATQNFEHYRLLPWGRAREALSGLSRATHLIFTKTEMENSHSVDEMKSFFQPFVPESLLKNAVIAEYSLLKPLPLLPESDREFSAKEPVTLISAIARPDIFESMVINNFNITVNRHIKFKDHHDYTRLQISPIEKGPVLTTEKDLVKLIRLDADFSNWFYVPVNMKLKQGSKLFYEDIHRLSS